MARGPADHEAQLDAAIAGYLRAEESGEQPDPSSWVRRFPALADDLRAFFDDRARVGHRIAVALPASGMLYGPYRILRLLGRGGMGLVFLARDERDDTARVVALKALPAWALNESSDLERFLREIDVTGQLVHPNIVPLLDAGTHAGVPYYVMAVIDGPDLREVLHQLRHARRTGTPPRESYVVALPDAPQDPEPLNDAVPPWRAIAGIGLQAARALEHAHHCGILHRDVKPSNLLLDRRGVVYLTDFGLARAEVHAELTRTDELAGALRFVAPERFDRWCDPRSDLYSLGLTLYELLTLRPAFEAPGRTRLIQAILTESPRRPRSINRAIPRPLERIVLKAMEKEPRHRYPCARDMAEDLERFLDGQPVEARRVGPIRRAWSWARRNQRSAAGIALLLLSTVGLVVGAFLYERMRAEKARIERDVARAEARASRHESLLVQLRQARSRPRHSGWSDRAWRIVEQTARVRRSALLRDQAAAVLIGPDAHPGWSIEGVGDGGAVAFEPSGQTILVGGQAPGLAGDGRARVVDAETGKILEVSRQVGPGPVAFGPRGEPLQLVSRSSGGCLLWDVNRQAEVARFDPSASQPAQALALSADGRRAATVREGVVRVWDVRRSGSPLREFALGPSAAAFTPDASLLALGDDRGRILVLDLEGESEAVDLSHGRSSAIHSLAFGPDPRRGPDGTARQWRLASGDAGGGVTIWDVHARHPTANCRGSQYEVTALSFSPDGTQLLSGGRYEAHLWDAATGEELLRVGPADHVAGIAFNPKQPRVAIVSRVRNRPARLTLWTMDEDRGIRTLRGLAAPIAKIVFSKDGRRAAALAQGWQAAMWDVAAGRALAVVDGPSGFSTDNAGMAISPDDRQLALAAGREARVWDIETGRLRAWSLPAGLCDALAWDDAGRLLLARAEKREDLGQFADDDWRRNPRLVRLRDLNSPEADRPLLTLTEGNRRTLRVALDANGRRLMTACLRDGTNGVWNVLTVTDVRSGRERWRMRCDTDQTRLLEYFAIDPAGTWVALPGQGPNTPPSLLEAATGRFVSESCENGVPSPDVGVLASFESGPANRSPLGCAIYHDFDRRRVTLGLDDLIPLDVGISFSHDGRLLGFGTIDGVVLVCDLEAVRQRLGQVGLGW